MPETQNPIEESNIDKIPEKKPHEKYFRNKKEFFFYAGDILLNAGIIIGLVFLIRSYVIAPFQVSGQSMCNTLNYVDGECLSQQKAGEYIIINKFTYLWSEPKRGDIVVFKPPGHPDEYYVKRVIGFPGEKVTIRNGKVMIINDSFPEGFFLEEDYLSEENRDHTMIDSRLKNHVFEVPENSYFVLGDNRNSSSDSRHWRDPETGDLTPFVNKDHIDGKVWLVLWPFGNVRVVISHEY